MDVRPIKTEENYRATLGEIESLMSAAPDSPEGERLDVLVTLVEAYERHSQPQAAAHAQNDSEPARAARYPGGVPDQAA